MRPLLLAWLVSYIHADRPRADVASRLLRGAWVVPASARSAGERLRDFSRDMREWGGPERYTPQWPPPIAALSSRGRRAQQYESLDCTQPDLAETVEFLKLYDFRCGRAFIHFSPLIPCFARFHFYQFRE